MDDRHRGGGADGRARGAGRAGSALAWTLAGALVLAAGAVGAENGVACRLPKDVHISALGDGDTPRQGPPPMIRFSRPFSAGKVVTVAAVGDVLLHDRLQKLAAARADGFADLWADVKDLLQAADVTYANLEGPAARDVAPNGRAVKTPVKKRYDAYVYRGYPTFNYNPRLAKDLKAAGFDVVSTANNHALDRHALGVDRTIEALEAAGLKYTGTRHRKRPETPWYAVTKVESAAGTYNIAWLACTYGTNDIRDTAGQVLLCYKQRKIVLETIRDLASRDDIQGVILTPHWGIEYRHWPTKKQRALAHDALEAGATAVIGSHPHVMQPWERYVTSDGREGLVIYSLGNFVSNQLGVPRRSSVIALVGLAPDPDHAGKLGVVTARFIPISMTLKAGAAGVRIAAQAVERSGLGTANRAHILQYLPVENVHPAATPFWKGLDCPS
jgi:poly-gamma-glutamate capsule biosynthesis protein CapA/YwtB (metallophosphatase superfamily)